MVSEDESSSSGSQIFESEQEKAEDVNHNEAQTLPVAQIPGPPPDGGLMAWLQVVGGFFALFNSWGVVNAFGAYESYYQSVLLSHESPSTIAWIGSIQGFFVIAGTVVGGRMVDAGYIKTLLLTGTFLITFGMMMASLSREFYQLFLAQGICTGLGCSCMFVAAVGVVASYFSKKRSFALGIMASGSSVGGVIYPIMVRELILRLGFPWATRVVAFTLLGTSAIPCVLLTPRLPPRKSGPLLDYPSFKDVAFIYYTIGCCFGFVGLYIPIFFIQSYSIDVGVDPKLASYMTSILSAGSVLGRTLPNFVADRTGPVNMLLPCTALAGVLCFAWIGISDVGGIIAFSVLFGFFSGTFVSLPPACIASMTPDMTLIGTRLGMNFFVCGFGVLMGTPVAGALIERAHGNYLHAKIFAGIFIALATLFIGMARVRLTGWVFFKKC
jgi:MFS family permease